MSACTNGVCALPRAYLRTGTFPALRYGGFAATELHLAPLRGYPTHPQKQYTRLYVPFYEFIIYPGGDYLAILHLGHISICETRRKGKSAISCNAKISIIDHGCNEISTIHSYNRRKVKEEDVPKYGRAVGTGTLIIGVSLIAAFVCNFLE
ncbi:MAG: hypothetical protein ACLU3I_06730 [Acutalibacteraceae bacterium]